MSTEAGAIQTISANSLHSNDDLDDLPTEPRVSIRLAETPEEMTRAEEMHQAVVSKVNRSAELQAMTDDELIRLAVLDNPDNLLAVELAARLFFAQSESEVVSADMVH